MLLIQKFHSIHEIDPEFLSSIENLLQEEFYDITFLKKLQDSAPPGKNFTYFLFFGPTQNTPIGFAQLGLTPLDHKKILPWYKRLAFWKKARRNWKKITWEIGPGPHGLGVFDPRFARSGREKLQKIVHEYELRDDILVEEIFCQKGSGEYESSWTSEISQTKEFYVIDPLIKVTKNYQEYLKTLSPEMQKFILESWKELHQKKGIKLGEYPEAQELSKKMSLSQELLDLWTQTQSTILTFEKEEKILGCIQVMRGKNGNIFFTPLPLEGPDTQLICDELYIQYALIKFFEMNDGKKCHLMKDQARLFFEDKNDLNLFLSQGFQYKTVIKKFKSRLKEISTPL